MDVNTENKKIIPFEEKDEVEKSEEVQDNFNPIEVAVNAINDINPEMGDMEAFAQMLAVPDEIFQNIAPTILETIAGELNDSNVALEIATALNVSGAKEEDFEESFGAICEEISKQLGETLSPLKMDFLKEFFAVIFNSISNTKIVSRRIINIPIELCHEDAKIPSYANIGDAGLDVYALDDYDIAPGETKLIPTGIKLAVPKGYEIQVRPKSGRALKTKLRVANTPGTIDSGYRDEVGVIIENVAAPIQNIEYEFDENGRPVITSILHGGSYHIGKGEKFAQLVLNEIPSARFFEVDSVAEIEGDRGGGFGSSGLA